MAQLQRLVIAPEQQHDGQIALNAPQQHYLHRVLRLGEGDRFVAMDGQGHSWLAQLKGTSAQILEPLQIQTELPITVTLLVALPKGNGFDDVVRCCTELGVATLVPVISDRTLLDPSPRKRERWQRIAQEASEQSERELVPTIVEPADFTNALQAVSDPTQRYICVARRDAPHLLSCLSLATSVVLATGPEGGWTPLEVENAIAAGFQPVSLGHRILRAVTAPIVALSLVAAAAESNTANPK